MNRTQGKIRTEPEGMLRKTQQDMNGKGHGRDGRLAASDAAGYMSRTQGEIRTEPQGMLRITQQDMNGKEHGRLAALDAADI